jgi:methionyl-tRNA synthetase
VDRYNADLANDLGNLVNRTLSMLQRYRQSQTPAISGRHLQAVCTEAVDLAAAAYEGLQPTDALAQVSRIISAGNHTIDEQKPWNLQKTGQDAALDAVLYDCGEACRIAAVLVSPVMPSVAREILRQLGITSAPIRWADTAWSGWRPGSLALSPEPIFPRIDPKRKAAPAVLTVTAPVAAEKTPGENAADLSIEEFQRVQLRVATIKSAERVEGARKLLKLILDVGDHERQIISGIADVYEPEALVGRQIAVIVNLKPARIRGVDSYGMLLAADADGKAILLQPDSPVPPGSPIR